MSLPSANVSLSVVGAVVAAGLGAHFLDALQLGPAERAEEERVIDHARLLVLEVYQADGHVKHAVVTDSQQRLELLAAHRVLELAAAGAEARRRAGCVHSHGGCPHRGAARPGSVIRRLRRASRPWLWLPRSCRPCRTPARAGDRSRRYIGL